ncbi:MAG: transcriptional repressor [Kandleria vitulina]|uniref:Fur family transcriptional regulator n=1 Tax=Kandleria vitulina TaxID=1630 RepID=UPI002E77074E|nr:transcriptional repressor [Kandleria vitulina]MEE0987789.1 transcriptional repressor [Kandleria vitulina]
MSVKMRQSKHRDLILAILNSESTHPTAEEIYNKAKEVIPYISLGTVYRNLNVLVRHDIIRQVKSNDQTVHYDGNLSPHYHLFCQTCGKIVDIFPEKELHQKLIDSVKKSGATIHYSRVNFIGECADCAKKKEEQKI